MRILSALHGAVGLERIVEPYDLSMAPLSRDEREAWGRRVRAWLQRSVRADPEKDDLVVLAGRTYAEPLRAHFSHVEEPKTGLGLGRRLRWLSTQTTR